MRLVAGEVETWCWEEGWPSHCGPDAHAIPLTPPSIRSSTPTLNVPASPSHHPSASRHQPARPAHLEVALAVVDEALGEHLVHARVLAVHVGRLGVAIVNLEHAAG